MRRTAVRGLRPRAVAAVVGMAVASTLVAAPAAAEPLTLMTEVVTATGPAGERLVVELRWIWHYVGPDAESIHVAYECDATFTGGASSVPLATAVGCYMPNGGLASNGVPVLTAGPRSTSSGLAQTHTISPNPICVEGYTLYTRLIGLDTLALPARCFPL